MPRVSAAAALHAAVCASCTIFHIPVLRDGLCSKHPSNRKVDDCLLEQLYKIVLESGCMGRSFKAVAIKRIDSCTQSEAFSVRQVIVHKRSCYSGVIIGRDVKARAPEEWLQHKYPPLKQDLKDTPHYRVLINKANGNGKSTAYIPEEEITIIMGSVVDHPDEKAYFSGYDGSKYIMLPWLKKSYPHD